MVFRKSLSPVASVMLAFVCSSLFALPLVAQERRAIPPYKEFGSVTKEQNNSLNVFLNKYKKAWAKQDALALSKLHSNDTEWTNAFARIIQGRDQLYKFLNNRLFAQFSREVAESEIDKMAAISTRYLDSDIAIIHLYTDSSRRMNSDGYSATRRVHIHLVAQRNKNRDQEWQIVHTAIMDAR